MFKAKRYKVITSRRVGNIENCSGSVVNRVISKITREKVMLNTSKISSIKGGNGIMIKTKVKITNPATIKS